MNKNSHLEDVNSNNDKIALAMYDKFLQLVHTSCNVDKDHDALSHDVSQQSQSLESLDDQLEEDMGIKVEESTNNEFENQQEIKLENKHANQKAKTQIEDFNKVQFV